MSELQNTDTYELDVHYILKSKSGNRSKVISGKTMRCSYLDEDRDLLLKDISKFEKKVKSHSNAYQTAIKQGFEEDAVVARGAFTGLRHFTRRFCNTWRSTFNEMINL